MHGGFALNVASWAVFVGFALPLAIIDVREHRLPNRLLVFAVPAGLAVLGVTVGLAGDWSALLRIFTSSAFTFLGLLALALVSRGALGMGDVKLGLFTGAYLGWLGWEASLWGTVLGLSLAGVYATALLIAGRAHRRTPIPLGPFLLAGVAALGLVAVLPTLA